MSPPNPLVNTFVINAFDKPDVDTVSKWFILIKSILGFNRLSLLFKSNTLFKLSCIFTVIFNFTLIFSIMFSSFTFRRIFPTVLCLIHYTFSAARCLIGRKEFHSYYGVLSKFDKEVGCKPSVNKQIILNLIQVIFILFVITLCYVWPCLAGVVHVKSLLFLPIRYVCVLEGGYYGHLLSLLDSRLQLINYHVESSLSPTLYRPKVSLTNNYIISNKLVAKKKRNMWSNMNNYLMIIKAYEHLKEAIKYQFLASVIVPFISLIYIYYMLMLDSISKKDPFLTTMCDVLKTLVMVSPILPPCVFGDRIYENVKKLKELLATLLYENKLDETSRRSARALLGLTESHDMSFRLFRMLDVNMSLPFKFMGFVITYLVILLQFNKIINP